MQAEIAGTTNDVHLNQSSRVAHRKGPHTNCVEQLKHGGVGSDSQGKRENHRKCETWIQAKLAATILEILGEEFQRGKSVLFPDRFPNLALIAKLPVCAGPGVLLAETFLRQIFNAGL